MLRNTSLREIQNLLHSRDLTPVLKTTHSQQAMRLRHLSPTKMTRFKGTALKRRASHHEMETKCDQLEKNFKKFLQNFKLRAPAHSVFKAYKDPVLSSKRSQSVGKTRLSLTKSPPPKRSESLLRKEDHGFAEVMKLRIQQHYGKIFKDLGRCLQCLVLSPAQEQEIVEFQSSFLKKIEDIESGQLFERGLRILSRLFSKLIEKIRIVVKHSSGLSCQKEKQLLGLVDAAAEQAAAIQILDFLPTLSSNLIDLKVAKGVRSLRGKAEAAALKETGLCFSRWRKKAAKFGKQPQNFQQAADKVHLLLNKFSVRTKVKRFAKWQVNRCKENAFFKKILSEVRPRLLRSIVSHLGSPGAVYAAVTDFYLSYYPDSLHHSELLLLQPTGQKLKCFLANKAFAISVSEQSEISRVVKEGRVIRYPEHQYKQLAPADRPLRTDLLSGSLIAYPVYSPSREKLGAVRVFGAESTQKEMYVLESVSEVIGELLGEMERHEAQTELTLKRIEELQSNLKGHSHTTETLRYFFEVLCCLHTGSSGENFNQELDFLRDLVSHVTARIFPSISSYSLFLREQHKLRRLLHSSLKDQSAINREEEAMLQELAGDELEIDEEILLSSREQRKNVLYIPLIDPASQTNFGTLLLKNASGSVQNDSNALQYQEYLRTLCAILGRWKAVQNCQSEIAHNMSQLEEQNDSLSHDMTLHSLLGDLRIELSSPDLDTFEKLQKTIQGAVLATRHSGFLSAQFGLVREDMLVLSAAGSSRRYEESLTKNRGRNGSLPRPSGTPDSSFHSFSTLTKVSVDHHTPKRTFESPLLEISLPLQDIPGLSQAISQDEVIILPLANLAVKPHIGGVLGNIFHSGGSLLNQQRLAIAFVPVVSERGEDGEGLLSFARAQEAIGVIMVCL